MADLSLGTLANLAEIIGAGSIVTGLVFGWFQIRYFKVQQRDVVAINLAQTFYNQDLARALTLLQAVPDGVTLEELRQLGDDYVNAAITVTTSFETMGLLVYKRIATIELVLDLAGGIVATMNRKLRRWSNDIREDQDQPSWGEWFEWLGDQAEQYKKRDTPAHIKYRDWKPR
ncbi:MAG: hypothetical protein AAF384_15840 [Pseudomonadota bacterium]